MTGEGGSTPPHGSASGSATAAPFHPRGSTVDPRKVLAVDETETCWPRPVTQLAPKALDPVTALLMVVVVVVAAAVVVVVDVVAFVSGHLSAEGCQLTFAVFALLALGKDGVAHGEHLIPRISVALSLNRRVRIESGGDSRTKNSSFSSPPGLAGSLQLVFICGGESVISRRRAVVKRPGGYSARSPTPRSTQNVEKVLFELKPAHGRDPNWT